MTSLPVLSVSRSWPEPPKTRSFPVPPVMMSSPSPPEMKSLPPLPLMVSCAPRPRMQSDPPPPLSVSLLDVPRMMFVPAGQQIGLSPSATVTLNPHTLVLPRPSLTLQLETLVPSGKLLPEGGEQVIGPTEPQLSVADVVQVATAPFAFVQSTLTLTGQLSTGGVLSL